MQIKLPIIFSILTGLLIAPKAISQVDLNYYLPQDVSYDANIPTPESIVGHQVGEWHISHDKLVNYMYALADASDRITIQEYARTFENRPLVLLTITSPENHGNIDEIRTQHVQLTDPQSSGGLDISNMPAVVYMGYNVHGNEPSGSNASLLMAYYLAAAQGQAIEDELKNTVVLLDPCLNPDGQNRFANWVNSRKGKNLVSDPYNMEQNEPWPGGRTNHYWFDLNRDWLPVQMPESKGRIRNFHRWKPNILTDHHEMGTNSTFFFQPGIPSRNHPLTPANTYVLTQKIANYHAEYLDRIGSLYYSKESFDDFYYGKGSTFPDVNGGVGILFEQASSRGHAQESVHGTLKFPFTIKNQLTTSLSTFKAAVELREELLNHQRDFFKNAQSDADRDAVKAYVFGSDKDPWKTYHLAEILKTHQIEMNALAKDFSSDGTTYKKGKSYIVPLKQKQYKLIKAMFEKRTTFQDSLFYDVSAWTLPLAFGVDFSALSIKTFNISLLSNKIESLEAPKGEIVGGKGDYAYAFEWFSYYSPKSLWRILKSGIKAKVANEPFVSEGKTFERGTILVPVQNQTLRPDQIYLLMQRLANETGIQIHNLPTGLTGGVNLGSPMFSSLRKPKLMMLVDRGVSSYEAGEVWHLLDQRYDMTISMVPTNVFNRADIDKYNTIIMVNGSYGSINKEKLKRWIQGGGTLIATKRAGKWLADNGMSKMKYKVNKPDTSGKNLPYALRRRYSGAQVIGGAIFSGRLDLTHPLAYGYENRDISLFRNSTLFMEKAKNAYANPLMYTSNPLLSGYISDKNNEKLKGTAGIGVSAFGSGRVITFADNPNFRAFWYGTNKLFMNAIFFGRTIDLSSAR
ncbi:MAG: M14 metallopeptidase family protein [Bacteroidota bacterium]